MDVSQTKMLWSNPSHLVFNRKLDVALRTGDIHALKDNIRQNNLTFHDKLIIKLSENLLDGCDILATIEQYNLYPTILLKVFDISHFSHKENWLNKAHDLASLNVRIQEAYMKSGLLSSLNKDFKHLKSFDDLPKELIHLSLYLPIFDELITKLGASDKYVTGSEENKIDYGLKNNHWCSTRLGLKIIWNMRVCIIQYKSKCYIYPRSYLLLIHNKLADTFSVLMLALTYNGQGYEDCCYEQTYRFVRALANLAVQYQSKYFYFAKVLEGVVVAMTLKEVDGQSNSEFYKAITSELLEEHSIALENLEIIDILSEVSIPLRHELGCLSKLMGHPFVNMKKGTEKLHHNVTEIYEIDTELVQATIRQCKKSFIKSYILRHHKWPLVIIQPTCPMRIVTSIMYNKDPDSIFISSRYGESHIEDYDHICLTKILEFDWLDNFIPYIKDKTISVLRSKVIKRYLQDDKEVISWKETRLLLHFILNHEITTSHIPYIEHYMKSENLDDLLDYLVMRIVPKEKELKEIYRGFGCRTPWDRARCSVQEKNTKSYLDLYSNEQASTLSELDILRRLSSFRNIQKAYPGYKPLYIVIDASAWNNHFRIETVDPVLKEILDKLYGTTIYSKTMLSYLKTLVYVPDTQGTWHWDGQLGGIEGQNQDSWMVVYIGQIHAAMNTFKFPYHIFCKGDDMRVVVMIPAETLKRQTIVEVKNEIVKSIRVTLEKLGHKVNIEESYASEHYFAFSKNASIGPIELPQSFRKIQKTYGANNAFLCLIDDYIGASYSNAHSSSKTSPNPTACYYVGLIWVYYHLLRSQYYQKLTDDQLIGILLIPGLVGGFPIIFLHNIYVRAESDLLSPFLGLASFVKAKYNNIYECIEGYLYANRLTGVAAFKGLLIDPYSLPIRKPTTPLTVLRQSLVPIIKKTVKNEQIKTIFKLIDMDVTNYIVNALYNANIYNAKVFSAFYAASPEGILNELIRKFETGRSILDMMIIRGGHKLSNKVLRSVLMADKKLQKYRLSKLRTGMLDDYSFMSNNTKCPYVHAQTIRDQMWGKHVESVTMAPVQHLVTIVKQSDSDLDAWSELNHFTYRYITPSKYLDKSKLPSFASSEQTPFIGYMTRNSMVPPRIHFIEKDLVLSKVKDLIDLISWTNYTGNDYLGLEQSSNFPDYIRYLLTLYLDVSPDQLTAFKASKKSGTISHHIRAPSFRESIIPNILTNIYQQWIVDSNSHVGFRSQGIHISFNFLHTMCYVISLLSNPLYMSNSLPEPTTYWAITTNCTGCLQPIIESPIVLPELDEPPVIDDLRISTLTANALRIVNMSITNTKRTFQVNTMAPDYITLEGAACAVVQEFIYTSFTKRLRMIDWSTHTSLSTSGYSVIQGLTNTGHSRYIGVTELARVPVEFLGFSVSCSICNYYTTKIGILTDEKISEYLIVTNAYDMPWFFLCEKLRFAGRLTHIIRWYQSLYNVPYDGTNNDLSSAVRYIGSVAFEIITRSQINIPLVHLSFYELSNLDELLRNHIYLALLRTKSKITHDDQTLVQLCCDVLDLLYMYSSQQIEYPFSNDSPYGTYIYQPFDVTLITTIDDFCDIIQPEQGLFPLMTSDKIVDICTKWSMRLEQLDELLCSHRSMLKFTILYTDLDSCIAYIRSNKRDDIWDTPEPIDVMAHDINDKLKPIQSRMMSILPEPKFIEFTPVPMIDLVEVTSVPSSLLARQSFSYRPMSLGSTGYNKLRELLHAIGISCLPHHQYYLCLCEGDGGFMCGISELTLGSVIVYNTLHLTPDAEELPTAALFVISSQGNSCDVTSVNLGYDDLSIPTTYNKLVSLGYKFPVITCDANRVGNYQDTIMNAVSLYNNCKTVNGIFLCKLYIDEHELNLNVISKLLMITKKVCLYKPNASHINYETYVIGYGGNRTMSLAIAGPIMNIKCLRVYNHHISMINEQLTFAKLSVNRRLYLDLHPPWKMMKFHGHCTFLVLLNKLLHVNLDYTGLKNLLTAVDNKQFVNLTGYIKRQIASLKTQILKRQHDADEDIGWSIDSRRRKTALGENILCWMGALVILTNYDNRIYVLDERYLRNSYCNAVRSLSSRLRMYPVTAAHYKGELNDNGFTYNPYKSYLNGVELALSLISYTKM